MEDNKSQLVERLKSVLQDTVDCYASLKETIENERLEIVNNKAANLPDLMAQKENITNKLKILADARVRVTEEIAKAYEVSSVGLTVTKIVSLVPKNLAEVLDGLKQKLQGLVKEVDFASAVIGKLIDSSKRFVTERLNIIRNIKPVTTYSYRGRIQEYSLKQGNMVSYTA